jgi:Zn-finger nucleic acid-binding protein
MPTDASSLHCPNCGAPAEPDAGRCRYCKARLATVSCPSCFALMFEGWAFCARCGTAGSRTAGDTGAALKCPGCRKPLGSVRVGTTELFECRVCDGIWLEAATFERLCADGDARAAVLHRTERDATAARDTRVRYRRCPECDKMMNRVNFGRISGVIVDVCKLHGTYVDAGELHGILSFIGSGGLERARARQIEELKEQERRALEAELRAGRERGRSDMHGHHNRVSWSFLIGGRDPK